MHQTTVSWAILHHLMRGATARVVARSSAVPGRNESVTACAPVVRDLRERTLAIATARAALPLTAMGAMCSGAAHSQRRCSQLHASMPSRTGRRSRRSGRGRHRPTHRRPRRAAGCAPPPQIPAGRVPRPDAPPARRADPTRAHRPAAADQMISCRPVSRAAREWSGEATTPRGHPSRARNHGRLVDAAGLPRRTAPTVPRRARAPPRARNTGRGRRHPPRRPAHRQTQAARRGAPPRPRAAAAG